jgi:curved DNA-binding protein CbpA
MRRVVLPPEATNYYVVLGIDEDADQETIRRAFRDLVRRYHPDAGEGSSSEAFRRVVEAYETLNDPARRRTYDRAVQREGARHSVSPSTPRVVESLGNRMTAEPMASRRFASADYRRPMEIDRCRIEVSELFEELLRSLDIGFSFVRRSRF